MATFLELKQYARDQGQDKVDAKASRRQGRIVNRALRLISSEKNWSFHRVHHRIILRPRIKFENICNMPAYSRVMTLTSGNTISNTQGGGLSVFPEDGTFYFSGDTELMRIQSVNSGRTQLTMFSTDLYVASNAASNATGLLVFDRYEMPANFKSLWTPPHEKDYYKDLAYVKPESWLYFRQTYSPNENNPLYYTLQRNPISERWEIHFWPIPNEYRSADFYIYVFPPKLSDDADVALWPEQLDFALFSAIDLMVVKELKDTKRYTTAERQYRMDVLKAKELDLVNLSSDPAGEFPRRGNKIQRSVHFRDRTS